jgi:hypothetical protein
MPENIFIRVHTEFVSTEACSNKCYAHKYINLKKDDNKPPVLWATLLKNKAS